MFDAQIAALKDRYRCVSFDFRGQGQTEVTKDSYDMDTLYEDAAALIETLNLAPCHFAGLSMGGFIGMRLAARRPELLRSLILMETSADPEPVENIPRYRQLGAVARYIGLRPVAGRVMPIMFGRTFMTDPARAADRKLWQERLAGNDKKGILRALNGVIERKPIYDELGPRCPPHAHSGRRRGCGDRAGEGAAHPCSHRWVAAGHDSSRRAYLQRRAATGRDCRDRGLPH